MTNRVSLTKSPCNVMLRGAATREYAKLHKDDSYLFLVITGKTNPWASPLTCHNIDHNHSVQSKVYPYA